MDDSETRKRSRMERETQNRAQVHNSPPNSTRFRLTPPLTFLGVDSLTYIAK